MSPEISKRYEKDLPWLKKLQGSTKENYRELSAKIYACIVANLPLNEFESQVSEIVNCTKNKVLEIQHGALLALSFMIEQKLLSLKQTNIEEISNLKVYSVAVETICKFIFFSMKLKKYKSKIYFHENLFYRSIFK